MTREHRRTEERHRLITSWVLTFLMYAMIILVMLVLNINFIKEMSDNPGPVNVKLGSLEGLDIPDVIPSLPPTAEPSPEPSAEPSPEASPEPSPSVEPEPSVEPSPVASAKPTASVKPSPSPKPTPKPSAKPSAKPSPKPSPKPSARPSPSASASPSPAVSPTIQPLLSSSPKPGTATDFKLPKGRDNGNSFETTFFNIKGTVGRVMGGRISQYMPLPQQVLSGIYENIGQGRLTVPSRERQLELFEAWYVKGGNNWQLKSDSVPIDQRDQLWSILEGAGYNLAQADYHYKNLRPVVLEFNLGKNAKGAVPVSNIRVVQSSGNGSIDDAVVYGFSQATFANNTDGEIKGRYTYSFE